MRIGEHAKKNAALLLSYYARIELSVAQAQQVLGRINKKLALLPKVIHQAHEQINPNPAIKSQKKNIATQKKYVEVTTAPIS